MTTDRSPDTVINKVQSIQRCIHRARYEYDQAGENFHVDYTRQDAAILNVTRACEQAIDLANHIIRIRKLGIPTSSAESFDLLARGHIITLELATTLKGIVGFRNIAVHQYEDLDPDIVTWVITSGLDRLLDFTDAALDHAQQET